MNVEIIAIGSELLQGRDNSDLVYLSKKLTQIGFSVQKAVTVADDISLISESFKSALSRTDIVISTGGLGPTFDDLTREALSKAVDKKLSFNKRLFEEIQKRFVKRGADCPEENRRQAYVFETSRVLKNNFGTAPGLWVDLPKGKTAVLLPGPPCELIPMFEKFVFPQLLKKHNPPLNAQKSFYMCGLSESHVNHQILCIVNALYPKDIKVDFTILANVAVIELIVTVKGKNRPLIKDVISGISARIKELFGAFIYSEKEYDLAKITQELLVKNKKTLSIAESCTGGLIASRLTEYSGSSKFLLGAVVPYSNEQKIKILKVKRQTIQKFGAVSSETVREMLAGINKIAGTDYSLAVSGIAGPSGGTKNKPVGLVYIGILSPSGIIVEEHCFSGRRDRIRLITVNKSLNMLRRAVETL